MKTGGEAYAYRTAEEVVATLNTDTHQGLTAAEVIERRRRSGLNELTEHGEGGMLTRMGRQIKSPLVIVLVLAGLVTLFLRDYIDALVIAAALLLNVTIGALQEERASHAFEKLNASQKRHARVLREGGMRELPVSELVTGDVVELHAGAYVPADIRLVHSKELAINESALTGEWSPVQKHTDVLLKEVPLAEQLNMAWMGTLVVSGYGRGVVVEIGDRTQIGLLASELQLGGRQKKTPLEQSISDLARFIMYLVLVALAAVFLIGLLRGQPLTEMFLLSVAVAVAAMPEGLPAVVTVVLALGMEAILKRGGLVRNLLAAETLGATTVILTDKTGTLTEAKMKLVELKTIESLESNRSGHTDDDRALLQAAILASDAFIEEEPQGETPAIVRGRPIEQALVLSGLDLQISQRALVQSYPRLDYLSFESERRYGASLNAVYGVHRLFVSGAPELLVASSTYVYHEGKRKRFTSDLKQLFLDRFARQSGDGMRVIATAFKDVPWTDIAQAREEKGRTAIVSQLTFMGLLAFADPVRADVPAAIKTVRSAGARVIMVTGDNAQTAQKIARDAGIAEGEIVVYTGDDIEKYDDEALYTLLKTAHVFARTLPTQKLRLVRVLKEHGEVVAMTGDGVNDAPALVNANIGVAVGSGTEVAKEASDIVLVNNSFSIIVAAIEEGRRLLDNLKKVIGYLLAGSTGEMIVITAALAVGAPLPFLPAQILWANMVVEGLMSFAFAFEPKESDVMQRDPHENAVRAVLSKDLIKLIVIASVVTGLILVVLYFYLLGNGMDIAQIRTILFVALSVDAMFCIFSLKSFCRPIWQINPFSNPFLLLSFAFSLALLAAAVFFAPLRMILGLTPLSLADGIVLLLVGVASLGAIEVIKFFVFRRPNAKMTAYGGNTHRNLSGLTRP